MNAIICGDVSKLSDLCDESVDLAIVDPPYYGVVADDWDNQWATLAEYLEWTKTWVDQLYRVTRLSGTLYLYGCTKNLLTLASVGIQLQNLGFEFREEIIINKGIKSVSGRTSRYHKCYPMVSENILYFVKDAKPTVKSILKEHQRRKGLTAKEMNEAMGFKSNGGGNWTKYAGDTNFPLLPTKEHWESLSNILDINIPYNRIGVTFNTEWGITNVWDDINFYSEQRLHPTQKPETLSKRLIEVSSNNGDNILDLFCGSGSVSVVSRLIGRNSIGIDISEEYCNIARERINNVQNISTSG